MTVTFYVDGSDCLAVLNIKDPGGSVITMKNGENASSGNDYNVITAIIPPNWGYSASTGGTVSLYKFFELR
jgi:hypothetical protein